MRKRWLAASAAAVVVIGIAVAERHALVRFALERSIGAATGYQVSIGDQRLGATHGALLDVRVWRNGEPVLDARRIDAYYSPRDLLPGSTHRFGLTGITIAAPQFDAIRHRDGTYNIILPSGASNEGAPGRPDPVPLRFAVHVRGGGATLVDQAEYAIDRSSQRIVDVAADATIDTSARTHYVATGALLDIVPQPFRAVGTVDLTRGYAMHHLQAKAIPVRTIGNFVINSAALRILAGTAHDVDAKLYALGIAPNVPFAYHVGATLDIADGRLYVASLAKPLEAIHGRLAIVDDTFFAKSLAAMLAGVPVAVAGGLYDFAHPQLRFGVVGHGDLARLRAVLHFAQREPVKGAADVGVLIEGSTGAPIVVADAAAHRAYYRGYPLDDVRASVALSQGVVYLSPMRAGYAGMATTTRGTLTLGSPLVADLAVHADASSDVLPYADELLPHEPMAIDVRIAGPAGKLEASGSLASLRGVDRASALFHFDPDGIAEVAPFSIRSGSGSLVGRYRLDRPAGTSAFWAYGHDLALHAPSRAVFPGAKFPQLPPIGGAVHTIALAGGGSGRDVILAGRVVAGKATVAGVAFDGIEATFGGNLQSAAISVARASGPWGRFEGTGSFSTRTLIARGAYAGTLQGLAPFMGGARGSGAVSGPVAISIATHRIVVQGDGLAFAPGAQIDGLPIRRASGTVAYDSGALRVYSANATVAGGRVVAAGTYARDGTGLALVGTGIAGGGLRGLGLPLDAGVVAVDGALGASRAGLPSFDGGVAVKNGRAQGYPVAGTATLALHDGRLQVSHGVGTLGSAVGLVGGTIAGLNAHAPSYALSADVPAADVAGALHTLHLSDYETAGVFNGTFAIGGGGSHPTVAGPLAMPGGSVNGLPFIDASGRLDADRGGASLRYGSARVGSTDVRFSAIARKDESAISVRSAHATLSDFNDYFDTGDTLAGVGAIAFSLDASGSHVATDGDVDVKGFRYRSLPIGDTIASWSSVRNDVTGKLAIFGAHGSLHAAGSVALARTAELRRLVARSKYDVTATLDDADLSTWLPAIGYPEVPLLGRVDASARVRGAYPDLRLAARAELQNGSIARLPIDSLGVSLSMDGDAIVVRNAELEAPALAATADGRIGLKQKMPIALSMHAISDDPARLIAQLTRQDLPISGTFETTARVGGTLAAPTFQAAFDASNFTAYGVVAKTLFGSARLNGDNLELRNAGATFAHGEATLAGTLPLRLAPFRVADDKPLSFDLALAGVDPGLLDGAIGDDTHLGGTVDGHVNLVGTLLQPHVYGRLTVANGSYVGAFDRTPVTGAVASLTFDKTTATLDDFDAHLGTGRLKGGGKIAFAQGFGAYGDVSYGFHAVASKAQIDLPAYGRGAIDGTLSLARTPPGIAMLSGTATASDAVVPFAAFLGAQGGSAAGRPASTKPPIDLGLDLALTAGNDVRIRGGGLGFNLDIAATGAAKLAGQLSKPTLDGAFTAKNGTLTYYDRAFRVNSASVAFDPADGVVPIIHATGTTHVVNPDPDRSRNPYGSVDISIKVDGSLPNMNVAFESDPPGYTKEQIIALIAPFGGFVNGIAFDPATGNPTATLPGNLAGAPVANTGQPLPGVLVPQANGTLTVGQEAFNLLNAQFTAGILAPIENVLSSDLGLDSVDLTVDYYGNVGINLRRKLAGHLNAVFASTFGMPNRESVGLEYAPTDSTLAQLAAFFESGTTRLYQTPGTYQTGTNRVTAGAALQGNSGFSLTIQRLFW